MTWVDALVEYASRQVDDSIVEALNARGVSDDQIRTYRIGYLDRVLPEGLPEDFLRWSGGGDKLDGVYVFPLTNVLGETHGLQFRYVERDRKGYMDYVSSKGEAVLFGLREAIPHIWRTGTVCLVEGTFDLFPVQRHMPETVATLTARVVEPLVWCLRRVCKRVVLGYDNDATGKLGVERFRKRYASEFQIVEIQYPQIPMSTGKPTKDPGDCWEMWGDVEFGAFLKRQTTGTDNTEW